MVLNNLKTTISNNVITYKYVTLFLFLTMFYISDGMSHHDVNELNKEYLKPFMSYLNEDVVIHYPILTKDKLIIVKKRDISNGMNSMINNDNDIEYYIKRREKTLTKRDVDNNFENNDYTDEFVNNDNERMYNLNDLLSSLQNDINLNQHERFVNYTRRGIKEGLKRLFKRKKLKDDTTIESEKNSISNNNNAKNKNHFNENSVIINNKIRNDIVNDKPNKRNARYLKNMGAAYDRYFEQKLAQKDKDKGENFHKNLNTDTINNDLAQFLLNKILSKRTDVQFMNLLNSLTNDNNNYSTDKVNPLLNGMNTFLNNEINNYNNKSLRNNVDINNNDSTDKLFNKTFTDNRYVPKLDYSNEHVVNRKLNISPNFNVSRVTDKNNLKFLKNKNNKSIENKNKLTTNNAMNGYDEEESDNDDNLSDGKNKMSDGQMARTTYLIELNKKDKNNIIMKGDNFISNTSININDINHSSTTIHNTFDKNNIAVYRSNKDKNNSKINERNNTLTDLNKLLLSSNLYNNSNDSYKVVKTNEMKYKKNDKNKSIKYYNNFESVPKYYNKSVPIIKKISTQKNFSTSYIQNMLVNPQGNNSKPVKQNVIKFGNALFNFDDSRSSEQPNNNQINLPLLQNITVNLTCADEIKVNGTINFNYENDSIIEPLSQESTLSSIIPTKISKEHSVIPKTCGSKTSSNDNNGLTTELLTTCILTNKCGPIQIDFSPNEMTTTDFLNIDHFNYNNGMNNYKTTVIIQDNNKGSNNFNTDNNNSKKIINLNKKKLVLFTNSPPSNKSTLNINDELHIRIALQTSMEPEYKYNLYQNNNNFKLNNIQNELSKFTNKSLSGPIPKGIKLDDDYEDEDDAFTNKEPDRSSLRSLIV